ncbi:hypothetical protein MSPP1_001958 [Malassezia sp. CBS 17886]|nr:hypothetical protein MSPP1_001958 [Malassezia sp. CBS 17886]
MAMPPEVIALDDDEPPGPPVQNVLRLIPGREQLEQERAARMAKRKREGETRNPAETAASGAARAPSPKAARTADARATDLRSPPSASAAPTRDTDARYVPVHAADRFWHGAVKVLLPSRPSEKAGLERVLLASYDVEIDWLETLFPDVPVTYIGNPPPGDFSRDPRIPKPGLYRSDTCPNWEMGVPRKPHPRALQHVKLLLLFHATFVRVVISTGNLTQTDWSRYENMFYVQDFPQRPASVAPPPHAAGDAFLRELEHVLFSLSLPPTHAVMLFLRRYSYADAAAHLVASRPLAPVAKGWAEVQRWGLGRLACVVQQLGVRPREPLPALEAQGSSLASYDRRWLEQFYLVALGVDPAHLPLPAGRTPSVSRAFARLANVPPTSAWPPVRVLFPTQKWVEEESVEGKRGAGCFFGKPQEFYRRELRPVFYQPVSQRGAILMHAKCLLMEHSWVYMGSANFTRAAWGTLGGAPDAPTLSLSNWELGVVLPWGTRMAADAVPYERPARAYAADDAPWDIQTM